VATGVDAGAGDAETAVTTSDLGLILLTGAAVVLAAIVAARITHGIGLPGLLVFLGLGLALGEAGVGGAGMVGSGTAAAQTRHVAAFSSVDLTGSSHVAVHVGGRQSVVVHADDNLLSQVTTQVHAGTLMIGTRGSFATNSPMRVQISVPSLEAVTLSGSSAITAGNIHACGVSVRLTGSGVVRASGTVTRLDISLGGSGDIQLGQLVAREVHAVLAGSGRIVTHATNTLQASVPGSGTIVYSGNLAHVTRSITGSGAIIRR
jgi:putative autotransporter adhesin-like protein